MRAMNIGLRTLCVAIVVICAGGSSVYRSAAESDPPALPGKLDPKSNSLALLMGVYQDSGYPAHQAVAIASRALGLGFVEDHIPDQLPNGALDPKSNVLALLHGVYVKGGWSSDEAMTIARAALNLNEKLLCGAYKVVITYGRGGNENSLVLYMNSRCYEDPDGDPNTNDGLNMCDILQCTQGQRWISLTVGSGCSALPPSGTCVQMRVETPAQTVDCDQIQVECSCFTETSGTVDCSQIEQCCCNNLSLGCQGCPSCSGPCPQP